MSDVGPTGSGVEPAPEFPVLDTLRFVGALCVLTTHTAFQSGEYAAHGIWGALMARLDVGVAIFFVLSGFLLFRPRVAAAVAGRPAPRTGRYYWKRLLRIYPVYVVTVVLALALIPDDRGLGIAGWVRSLFMLDTFLTDRLPQGLTQMWSLAVEVSFYLVLPLLAALALGRRGGRPPGRRLAGLLVALVAVSLVWHLGVADAVDERAAGAALTWLPAYLTWFAVGMALAWVHVRWQQGHQDLSVRAVSALGALPGVCWVAVTGLMLVAATPLAGPTQLFIASPGQSATKHLLYALVGGLLVVTGVFADRTSPYAALMSHPLPRHLGHISYSTFCLHLPVLYFVFEWGGHQLFRADGLVIWSWTLGVSLVLSEIAYRLIEKPANRLRGWSPGRRRGAIQPSTKDHATTTSS